MMSATHAVYDQNKITRLEDEAKAYRARLATAGNEIDSLRAENERRAAEILRISQVYHDTQWRQLQETQAENERLTRENYMLKQALGYPIPADYDTPNNPFRCGVCDARNVAVTDQPSEAAMREARELVFTPTRQMWVDGRWRPVDLEEAIARALDRHAAAQAPPQDSATALAHAQGGKNG